MSRGIRAVENALGIFESVLKKLYKAVTLCDNELIKKEEVIQNTKLEKEDLVSSKIRAEKVILKVQDLIKGE